MLEVPRAESTGNKKHVVRVERLVYNVCFDTQALVIGHGSRGGADVPFEILNDLHRFQPRYRIVEPDEIQGRKAVKYHESCSHVSHLLRGLCNARVAYSTHAHKLSPTRAA